MAVLEKPPMLAKRARRPIAMLEEPSRLLKSARNPSAVLSSPVSLTARAWSPIAVFRWELLSLERDKTDGCIVGAGFVEKKRHSTHRRVVVSGVECERPRADAGVEVGGARREERKPTNCCVSSAGGEAFEGVGPFRRGEVGIAAIWRRIYPESFRGWGKREEAKCQEYCCEYVV